MNWVLGVTVAVSMTLPVHFAVGQERVFEEGNQLYLDGNFVEALQRYQQVLDAGFESAPLYYNLGNAHFKLGDLGRAVLNYERALRLAPGDDDARANLELARSLTADEITPLPRFWLLRFWDWWYGVISGGWLWYAVALVYVAVIGGVVAGLMLRRPHARRAARAVVIVCSIVLSFLGLNLVVGTIGLGIPTEAVVLTDEVLVQSAPSDDRTLQVFTIHAGTKLRVDQLTGEWAEIVLEDGKVGWVRQEVFEII